MPHGHRYPSPKGPTVTRPPSPVYIFDLDDVLMPTEALFAQPQVQATLQRIRGTAYAYMHAAYQQFVPHDPMLIHRLRALRGDFYLLTNGSHSHALAATDALGVYPYLVDMVHANSGVGMKPQPGPYRRIEQLVRARYAPQVPTDQPILLPPLVFFDDRVENHEFPKQRGWTTVWIHASATSATQRPPYVDYIFPNVYAALEYFLMLQKQYSTLR